MKKNLFSALAVAFMLVIALASGGDKSAKKDSDSEQTTAESGPKTKWEYSEETDKMEGTTNYYAGLKSTNKVNLKFPYKGGSTLSIFVRNLGKGNEVYLFLDKGQIMPSLIGEKTVKFKFDDEATVNYKYTTATGSANNYVFLDKEKEILNKLLKAKKVMVEIDIFDAGLNVFEYDAQGLVWDKK
ncbi:hypothetical protein [Myroides odoratus]|uniref:hypothetical protein n=1 Tax=Myroides odoratus TaxID=256 RepID=UPI000765D986|nr:hypothetical protein [Myroides odoratus]